MIGGFAGATADAFTLFERLEKKLEAHRGQLLRAAVELAKDWRTDKYLRNLEAMMIVADAETMLILTGNGDVLEPEGGIAAIGSGGNYALAAARALADYEQDPGSARPQGDGDRRRGLRLHQRPADDRDASANERRSDPQGDRRRTRRAYHRPERREEGGRGGASQPLAAAAAVGPSCARK